MGEHRTGRQAVARGGPARIEAAQPEGDNSLMAGPGDRHNVVGNSAPPRVRWALHAGAMVGVALLVSPALAATWVTYPVDDSLSQVQASAAQFRWRSALPSRDVGHLLDATMDVRIVLNVAAWVGNPARIYMVMPPVAPSNLTVQWATAGTLLPGRLSGGQRQLVYQGVIPGPRIEDTLRVLASTDASDAATPQRVRFTFEIETPSR